MQQHQSEPHGTSRRDFIRTCALGATFVASGAVSGCRATTSGQRNAGLGPAGRTISLNRGWLFGGKFSEAATEPAFDDSAFSPVTLPHCVAAMSWQDWKPAMWEEVWIYRRHFAVPAAWRNARLFLDFEAVMAGATPVVNGHSLPKHKGGYLPFQYEITNWLKPDDNVLALAVDSRWLNVPPAGSPRGPGAVDYYLPGGIIRPVRLRVVPPVFISDLFAKPVNVLESGRRVEVTCAIDAAVLPPQPLQLEVDLMDGARRMAGVSQTVTLAQPGETQVKLTLSNLGNVALWDAESPRLYEVVATLKSEAEPLHAFRRRIGFREARFELDGFYLNGRRRQLFGLNRHELFPYVGYAMPERVIRRDARILRHELNCNVVRCSHYPQAEAFLDACDELGLMVWEETPGWQYVGDQTFQDLVVRDVQDMVRRDRNHPSIIIWGVRVNESANQPALYRRTKEVADTLDGSRPTSGSMTPSSRKNWQTEWRQDVFAFDDYHADPDGSVGIEPPVPGVPYLLAEAVGQMDYGRSKTFRRKYRRAGDLFEQQQQAVLHAQAHSKAARDKRGSGVIAWCAFDYGSPVNSYQGVKCPGVADIFRIPKLGASFYRAQGEPQKRPVIEPSFYWDFGPQSPRGPGKNAAIFSNCDRLELFLDGRSLATLHPDRENYPNLSHPPFFVDLELDGSGKPELRIDGYVGRQRVLSRAFSANPAQDQFVAFADDAELVADGSDATRLVVMAADKFGAVRPFFSGTVTFAIAGPGILVGDNPFELGGNGGAAAVYIKTKPGETGRIQVTASHPSLGTKSVKIEVRPAPAE